MKIEDVYQSVHVHLSDGTVQLVDYTIKKEDLKHFLSCCRTLVAKSNRLLAQVEILDRPMNLQDLNEFSLSSHTALSCLYDINGFLAHTEATLINYEEMLKYELKPLKDNSNAFD